MSRPTAGPSRTAPTTAGIGTYEIRVAGHLDDHWAATLGQLTLVRLEDGTTSLTGPVADQAHLHGLLTRIRDLGAPLLMLRTLDFPVLPHGVESCQAAGRCASRAPVTAELAVDT